MWSWRPTSRPCRACAVPWKTGSCPDGSGYEAGQSAVGDHFGWFVDHAVPPAYHDAAAARGQDIHVYLQELAGDLAIGESGLLALDWWNGNRSVLVDTGLSGLLLGATLATVPEEIYRALIEATAFGTRVIIETFEANGVPIHDIVACGGLAEKSPLIMQIYADVTGKTFRISASDQTPALGSAMHAAVAAGRRPEAMPRSRTPRERWPACVTRPTSRSPRTMSRTTRCTANTSGCTTTSVGAATT
ncbi:MAG: FGGY-family carbohydrate kinase [Candidatus Limnocylindrales bacterium]